MEMLICNPQKGRLETIEASINETNTTWFDDCQETDDIYTITDIEGDLLIVSGIPKLYKTRRF